jgi:hypothetical protein
MEDKELHLLSLLAVEEANAPKPAGEYESIWLIIIAIILIVVLFSYSSRLNNLDKMIQMLNEKINNLEDAIQKLKIKHRDHIPIFGNKNIMVPGPFNEDNIEVPEELIDTTPKISKLFDPRIKHKDNKKENDKKE